MSPSERRRRAADLAEFARLRRRGRLRRERIRARRRRRLAALVVTLGAVAVGVGVFGFGGAAAFRASCTLASLRPVSIGQNSFVYAADNSLLGSIPAEKNREPVALRQISPWVRKATIAIEDRRFYEHGGVDYVGIGRALWADVRAGRVVEGGSTITQQLVRNLYISRERTIERKLKEACLAIKLNRARSKDWILENYMNVVYFGNHAYGIEAAAKTYFSRPASRLTLLQAALLAGLPQAPSFYDPMNRPADALRRRDAVLRAMLENGDIPRAQYREAVSVRKLGLRPGRLYKEIREPYFFSYVREELVAEYGANTVRSGGLKVYTTVDPRFQRAARAAITKTLYLKDDPAAALVAINPANGAIRAMTAVTPGRRGNQFNLAAQGRRQAGSTFKTFVLAAAIRQGINPDTTSYTSSPFTYQPDPLTEAWHVETYDKSYTYGSTSIRSATLRSDNTVYARLTLDVGPEKVAATARLLGVQTPLEPVPSLGLGSIAVSPLDMASAYATLAAGGIYSKPMAIRRVLLANGKEDTDAGWGKPLRTRVIADWVADAVTDVLEDNMTQGTGTSAQIGRPAAGKTGTTDDHADAWFCGYTPNLQATVWIGYPGGEIPMRNVHGISVSGSTFPAQIWRLFMESAIGPSRPRDWPEPKTEPIWHPFNGQYAHDSSGSSYYGDYSGYSGNSTTTTTNSTTTPARPQQRPARPTPTPPPAPPPAPPPVEEPPPPPPVEEPPPPPDGPSLP